jgi:hypothetical protein
MFDSELDGFKRNIDLRSFAAAEGFQLDPRQSGRGSSVMRHPASDEKVIIKRGPEGHYVWFSVRSDASGTILDFVHYLRRGSAKGRMDIGAIRRELRIFMGQAPVFKPAFPPLVATTKDSARVEAEYAKMQDASRHPYLEGERALPFLLLQNERFAGRIRVDRRSNAVFPHFDADGLCGFEKKNIGHTSFSSGGTKGLWLSQELAEDSRLAFFESAIDGLSYAALFPDEHTRYASIGGKPNPVQPELVRAAIARMPQGV